MIFGERLLSKVLAGEQIVTRRPVRYNESGKILPCKYKVGRDYALQGPPEKGSKARAKTIPGYRLLIKSERVEPLKSAKRRGEAKREGFDSYADLFLYIARLYPRRRILHSTEFHRIAFELVEVGQ